jgi:hypothetical protein
MKHLIHFKSIFNKLFVTARIQILSFSNGLKCTRNIAKAEIRRTCERIWLGLLEDGHLDEIAVAALIKEKEVLHWVHQYTKRQDSQ